MLCVKCVFDSLTVKIVCKIRCVSATTDSQPIVEGALFFTGFFAFFSMFTNDKQIGKVDLFQF